MSKTHHTMTIAGLQRDLPLCPISDELKIGAFVIFGDPELTTACAEALNAIAPEHDVLITAESKGIPLVHEMARLEGNARYVLARKAAKLYMKDVFSVSVSSITTVKKQTLCISGDDANYLRGKSLHALEQLVEHAGGNIVAKMAILAEGDATERDDILYLEKLPLFDAEGNPIH